MHVAWMKRVREAVVGRKIWRETTRLCCFHMMDERSAPTESLGEDQGVSWIGFFVRKLSIAIFETSAKNFT